MVESSVVHNFWKMLYFMSLLGGTFKYVHLESHHVSHHPTHWSTFIPPHVSPLAFHIIRSDGMPILGPQTLYHLYPEVISLTSPPTTLSVPQASWCPDTLGISLPQGFGPCPPLCLHDLCPNFPGLPPFLRLASTFQWALPRPLWKNFSILPTLPTFLASFSFFAFTGSIIYHTMLDPWRTWGFRVPILLTVKIHMWLMVGLLIHTVSLYPHLGIRRFSLLGLLCVCTIKKICM